jgi:hypothetical protein
LENLRRTNLDIFVEFVGSGDPALLPEGKQQRNKIGKPAEHRPMAPLTPGEGAAVVIMVIRRQIRGAASTGAALLPGGFWTEKGEDHDARWAAV